MYAMICIRPDVAYALSVMSRFKADLSKKHWKAAKCIFKYLRRIMDLFMIYGKEESKIQGDTNSSF